MVDIVPADQIEQIVGTPRHQTLHYGRAVHEEQKFYILHSEECRQTHPNLRLCEFSRALDATGINEEEWFDLDTPAVIEVLYGNEIHMGHCGVEGCEDGYIEDSTACGDPEHCDPVVLCSNCNPEGAL